MEDFAIVVRTPSFTQTRLYPCRRWPQCEAPNEMVLSNTKDVGRTMGLAVESLKNEAGERAYQIAK